MARFCNKVPGSPRDTKNTALERGIGSCSTTGKMLGSTRKLGVRNFVGLYKGALLKCRYEWHIRNTKYGS